LSRRAPRALGPALDALLSRIAPATTLARVQAVWGAAAGPAVAAHGLPVAERDGLLTVACDEAVWAAEIELMGPELVAAVNAALGDDALGGLRCRAGGASRPGRRRGARGRSG
jgi:predicted nucleic acid-binding Zn ribbon protein